MHPSHFCPWFRSKNFNVSWNDRARTFIQPAGLKKPWSYVCRQHWKLALRIANLSEHRWVRRTLAWNPCVRYRSLGRRPHTWDYQIQNFLSIQRCGAMAGGSEMPPSLDNTLGKINTPCADMRNRTQYECIQYNFLFTACAQNGPGLWRAGIVTIDRWTMGSGITLCNPSYVAVKSKEDGRQ